MCGLFFVMAHGRSKGEVRDMVDRGLRAQSHRGPDGRGIEIVEGRDGVVAGIGHLRLSILDPRPESDQPLRDDESGSILAFNGEIYNYRELRGELRPRALFEKSIGDTAVMLAGLVDHGPAFLPRMNGMWAYILHDPARETIQIGRDRFGIKPLYVYHQPGELLILSSEIKGILAVVGGRAASAERIAEYLVRGRTNFSGGTFFEGIEAFDSAAWAEFPVSAKGLAQPPKANAFWVHPRLRPEFSEAPSTAEEIRELFKDAVRLHLRSDVPYAVTLSGGIDSTALICAARALDPDGRLTAFSAASRDPRVTEEPFQRIAAAYVGCDWRRVQMDDRIDALFSAIGDVTWHNDQPLKSISDLALFELCREARSEGVIVMLNGQGADEQLCGYNKYLYAHVFDMARQGNLPRAAATIAGFAAQGTVLNEFRYAEAKRYIPSLGKSGDSAVFGPALADQVGTLSSLVPGRTVKDFEVADLLRNSVPQLLHAEDRLSMAASTEMRVPFLDYRLVERLAAVPAGQKLRNGWTKHIFR
ncbi:asparagine synthase (glutamine-hydrolyzing), partial [Brevundimonas sp.]|uniref:asparagine synthase (glutamine-hydrolyzing) n=1 Tax=Brevundimonas sp. TaxID=1871086 RepID=UPI0035AE9878